MMFASFSQRSIIEILIACSALTSCSSNWVVGSRPHEETISKINEAAKDHWVVVTTTDSTKFEGDHFQIDTSFVRLVQGGSRTADKEGVEDVTIPIDAVATIDVKHVSAWKPLYYPAAGAVIALGIAVGGSGGAEETGVLLGLGTGIGAVVGVGYFLFWTLPDLLTDRPTYHFRYSRPMLPITVVDSTGH
jgi:hypothetical protein